MREYHFDYELDGVPTHSLVFAPTYPEACARLWSLLEADGIAKLVKLF
jgi:hypothetical protein